MADTLVQQPIPQPSEVPPVTSAPPVMNTPPVMSVPPSPISQKVEPPKSKISLVVAGVVALVMMVGVGVWGYSQYSGTKTPQIAKLTEELDGGITVTQTPSEEAQGKGGTVFKDGILIGHLNNLEVNIPAIIAKCKKDKAETGCTISDMKTYLTNADNNYDSVIGGSCSGIENSESPSICAQGQGHCVGGICQPANCANGYTPSAEGCVPNPSLACKGTDYGAPVCCYDTSCAGGTIVCEAPGRKECKSTGINGEKHCLLEANSVDCGGKVDEPNERRSPNPSPSVSPSVRPSPSPSPSPTMACTGLTQTPATQPVVGSKLTFTCAGSVTPSNASTLSYNFRYAINNGAWVNLTNKTTATAELTISACGTYKVECRACATFGGLIKCDPFWQYAGVQPL